MGREEGSGDASPLPLGTKVPQKHGVPTGTQWRDPALSAVPAARGGSDGSGRGARSQQRAAGAAAAGCRAPIPIPVPVPIPILIPTPVLPTPYLHPRILTHVSPQLLLRRRLSEPARTHYLSSSAHLDGTGRGEPRTGRCLPGRSAPAAPARGGGSRQGAGRAGAGEGGKEGGRERSREGPGWAGGGGDRAPPPPAARPLPAAALSGEAGNQPRARLTTPPARFKDTKPARSRRGEPGPRSAVPTPLPPPPPLRYCLVPREWTQPVATGLDP